MESWIVVGVVTLAVVAFAWVSSARQYHRNLLEIRPALDRILRAALDNVLPDDPDGGIRPPTGPEMDRQFVRTSGGLGLFYTVGRVGDSFVHHVSGKAPGCPRKLLLEGMLFVMLDLSERFKACGFPEEGGPALDIGESELGTVHVEFTLDAARQARMEAEARCASVRAAP
jgi:hypothetical protein